MQFLGIRQVSVWLDESEPERGAFEHALEWASRFGVPLHGVVSRSKSDPGGGQFGPATARTPGNEARSCGAGTGALQACAAASSQRGVSWRSSAWQKPLIRAGDQLFRPRELCVFGQSIPLWLKAELLRRSFVCARPPVLVCPQLWEPVSRVLILHQHRDPGNGFLDVAGQLCRTLDVTPVVMTVARSAREARLRQAFAEERLARLNLPADFDFIIGSDVRTAVACLARWRRCSHVFLERENAPFWWRWLRGDLMEQLLGLSESLTFLALPGVVELPVSQDEADADSTAGPANRAA
jgi:hypothetical protein